MRSSSQHAISCKHYKVRHLDQRLSHGEGQATPACRQDKLNKSCNYSTSDFSTCRARYFLPLQTEMAVDADKQCKTGLESSTGKPVLEDSSPDVDLLGDQNVDPALTAKLHLLNNVGHLLPFAGHYDTHILIS